MQTKHSVRTTDERLLQTTIALMIRLENVHVQFQRGLIDEASLANYGMVQSVFVKEGFWGLWEQVRATFGPEFVDFFEGMNARPR